MILTGKIFIKIPKFFLIFARKINRIAEFYMIFARKTPEFHVIIAGKNIFFLGGGLPPAPVSYTAMSASGPNPSLCPWMDNGHNSTFQSVSPPLVRGHMFPSSRRDLGACGIIGPHRNGFPGPAAAVDWPG